MCRQTTNLLCRQGWCTLLLHETPPSLFIAKNTREAIPKRAVPMPYNCRKLIVVRWSSDLMKGGIFYEETTDDVVVLIFCVYTCSRPLTSITWDCFTIISRKTLINKDILADCWILSIMSFFSSQDSHWEMTWLSKLLFSAIAALNMNKMLD